MENTQKEKNEKAGEKRDTLFPLSILVSAIIMAGAWIYTTGSRAQEGRVLQSSSVGGASAEGAVSVKSVVLPVRFGDVGTKMAREGVIDEARFRAAYAPSGKLPPEIESLFASGGNRGIVMNAENADALLGFLWAFGLGNENPILENGPMMTYGGAGTPAEALATAGRLASTGGWSLAKGDAMQHYSKHAFVMLTSEEQRLVGEVAKNIYRPCCDNSTYFPDCNHGMAMLGLLELMASQGATESQMYQTALAVNSLWFPDVYGTIARYVQGKGIDWASVNPKDVLGADFSSASGYQQVLKETQPAQGGSSLSC